MSMEAVSRRAFLRSVGILATATLVAACQPKVTEAPSKGVTEVAPQEAPTKAEQPATSAPAPAQMVELRVMTRGGADGEYHRHFSAKFDEEHPNITVKAEDTIYDELLKKQELGFVSGTMQDVVFSGQKWFPYACYKGMYLVLDDLIEANPYNFDDYFPIAVEACRYEGRIYGLPGDAHPHTRELLVWNRPLYEQAGYTWPPNSDVTMDELKEIAMKGTRPDEGTFGTQLSVQSYYDFDCVVTQPFGGFLLSKDGKKMQFMDDPAVVEATKWYLELVKAHATPYRSDLIQDENMFYAGKMLSYNTGVGNIVGVEKATEGKFEWGWTLVPKGPKGLGSSVFMNQWAVGSKTAHAEEAYELAAYLTSAEVGIWMTVENRKQPNGSRTAWYSKEVAEALPHVAACAPWFEQENLLPFPMPYNLRYAEFQDTWVNLTDPMFYGEKTWDEVAPEVTKKCQEILDLPLP